MAELGGADLLEFRLRMLDGAGEPADRAPNTVGGATRLNKVLVAAVSRSGYGQQNPPREHGHGCHVRLWAGTGDARLDDLRGLIENDYYPVGAGEPALSVVAPAIASAITKAVSARVRGLSITPWQVRDALR